MRTCTRIAGLSDIENGGRQPLATEHCLFACFSFFVLAGREDETNSGRLVAMTAFQCRYIVSDHPAPNRVFF